MNMLKFDLTQKSGAFKHMNAVNNGPVCKRHANNQVRSNMEDYKAARIPYARNHDASLFPGYGGHHTVDIEAIFPDFDKDPYDPESYDFVVTDEHVQIVTLSGAEVYYRLGASIEHYIKKFRTLPPKDFKKWAVICEHIIRHYTEGWADGFNFNITYWEIWNEPDLDPDDSLDKRCWGGTKAEFFDLFEIAAKHLKSCFPHLKIGGPALAYRLDWAADFLAEMRKRNVPIDFFSWHIYAVNPEALAERGNKIRKMLDENGYNDTESILNEWNYVKGWTDEWVYSIETMIGMKGAAFVMACMSVGQDSSIDMLMYYDARPSAMNGMFDFYTLRTLKGYYPFLWFSDLKDKGEWVKCETEIDDIYTLCACDENNSVLSVITYYTDEENMPEKTVEIDFGKEDCRFEIYILDDEKSNELVKTECGKPVITLKPNTCAMIKEI